MAVWVVGDPHLSLGGDKPMDVFGPNWERHQERLADNWRALVGEEDCVIVAGDVSWALRIEDAVPDLRFLDSLPGKRKILLRGNHDYWWTTRRKVTLLLEENQLTTLQIFQNEAILLEEAALPLLMVGTRGWKLPFDEDFSAEDRKVYLREVERLRLSLKAAADLRQSDGEGGTQGNRIGLVAVLHYPPVSRDGRGSELSDLLEAACVKACYYGHVHGYAGRQSFRGERNGIEYFNIACDQIDCTPQKIAE
ncbi:MAG: serine/threonine protein phosphatase [Clostridia bacterium]|nr:serine/threonine protein phosphatase [Clostridia bacterium]